jgi:hypothetical protein
VRADIPVMFTAANDTAKVQPPAVPGRTSVKYPLQHPMVIISNELLVLFLCLFKRSPYHGANAAKP